MQTEKITFAEAARLAGEDYKAALGTTIRPEWINGYIGENSKEVHAAGRVAVRVTETEESDIARDMGGFLDPAYNVEIVHDPEGICADMRSLWTWGKSYEISKP